MDDFELFTKTLRAILHMNKGRLSLSRLKSEYKLLTGEHIAYHQMGHNSLVSLLASLPSIIHMERNRFGEMMCFSSVANEKPPTAKLGIRQHISREMSRPRPVSHDVRVKPAAPRVFNAKPQTSLRQPNHRGRDVHITMTRDVRVVDAEKKTGTHPNTKTRPPSENRPSSSSSPPSSSSAPSSSSSSPPSSCSPPSSSSSPPSSSSSSPPSSCSPPSSSSSPPSSSSSSPPSSSSAPSSPAALSPELKLKLKELLMTFPHGVWAKALPQLFQDNYKTKLPGHVLDNLRVLTDICEVVCPLPHDPKKVIVYSRSLTEGSRGGDGHSSSQESAAI